MRLTGPYRSTFPGLETNEEFLVVRAKVRPVILIQTALPLAGVDNRGYRGRIQRHRTLVAQVFGLADSATKEPQFNPTFIDRVRRMEFPQLMFLPEKTGVFSVDSMLRLDEAQSVFVPHLDAKQFCLSDEMATILRHQLAFIHTQIGPNDYTDLREFLMNESHIPASAPSLARAVCFAFLRCTGVDVQRRCRLASSRSFQQPISFILSVLVP